MKPNDVGEDPGNTELPLAPDVSELRWVTPETAEELLTYERERNLVRAGPPAVGREPRLLSRLVARVLGRTRDTMFPGPERKRLRSSIEVTRSSLSYALAKGEAAGSWTVSAHNLLTAAAEEARGGDLDSGWKYLHEAGRQALYGMEDASLQGRANALLLEAQEKLSGWRSDAVKALLLLPSRVARGRDGQDVRAAVRPMPTPELRERLYVATSIRDEHSDNVYFRNRLLRRQMLVISVAMTLLVSLFVYLLSGDRIVVGGKLIEDSLRAPALLAAMSLGGIGACLSALIGFSSSSPEAKIPAHLANVIVTATRPLIGALSGVVAALVVASGTLKPPGGVWLVIAFAFGFSERLVVGALDKVGKGAKEGDSS